MTITAPCKCPNPQVYIEPVGQTHVKVTCQHCLAQAVFPIQSKATRDFLDFHEPPSWLIKMSWWLCLAVFILMMATAAAQLWIWWTRTAP